MTDFYAVLGVERGASQDDIKKAYRKKAFELHPDKNGGDSARMSELNVAYSVLADHERKEHYDQTGHDKPNVEELQASARQILIQTFTKMLDSVEFNHLGFARDLIQQNLSAIQEHRRNAMRAKDKALAAKKKFKVSKGDNLIHNISDLLLKNTEEALLKIEKDEQVYKIAMEMLQYYSATEDASVFQGDTRMGTFTFRIGG